MNSDCDFTALSLLQAYGLLPQGGIEKISRCQRVTKLSLAEIVIKCRLLSEREAVILEEVASAICTRRISFLKGLLLFQYTLNTYEEFSILIERFSRLNPLALHLLQRGKVGIHDLLQCMYAPDAVDEIIDGYHLWGNGLITLSQWQTALAELRQIQTGVFSVAAIENSTNTYLSPADLEVIFESRTWLFPARVLFTPRFLKALEQTVCNCRNPYQSGSRLNIAMSLEMQRLIIFLKDAVDAGRIGLAEARSIAGCAYAAPDLTSAFMRNLREGGCKVSGPSLASVR